MITLIIDNPSFKTVYSAVINHLKCNACLKVKRVDYKVNNSWRKQSITFPFISTIFPSHTFKNIYYCIKIKMLLARISKAAFDRPLIKYSFAAQWCFRTILQNNNCFEHWKNKPMPLGESVLLFSADQDAQTNRSMF